MLLASVAHNFCFDKMDLKTNPYCLFASAMLFTKWAAENGIFLGENKKENVSTTKKCWHFNKLKNLL